MGWSGVVMNVYTEYGVRLAADIVMPASSRTVAWQVAGRERTAVRRQVAREATGRNGRNAVVQYGPWVALAQESAA